MPSLRSIARGAAVAATSLAATGGERLSVSQAFIPTTYLAGQGSDVTGFVQQPVVTVAQAVHDADDRARHDGQPGETADYAAGDSLKSSDSEFMQYRSPVGVWYASSNR